MADYQTHLTGAIITGAATAFAASILGVATPIEAPFLAMVGVWGGLAPDLDSDNSRPLRIVFDYASLVVPFVMLWRIPALTDSWARAIVTWLVIAAVVRWPMKWVFQRFTVHRGIFHSIPAALIFGGLGFLLAGRRVDDVHLQAAIGVSALIGYLTHLTLDELWSVDFEGRRIKKSFGSALALTAPSRVSTGIAYALLAIIGLLTWEGLGGRRPEGLWADNLGDAPVMWLKQGWLWVERQIHAVFTQIG
ncbi:MAG: metal-dependent hydrolase [Myxococcota bacterium]